jgi:ABC-2 type transport system ATP-binding protein/lipopolysaccharide transport system ATP-binding protein
MDPVIVAEDLSKRFILRHNHAGEIKVKFLGLFHRNKRETLEDFWALRGVSTTIGHGEAVGVIGRNGSGKSTFLKLVAGLHRPTSGRLLVARGARIGTMIELGVGFHGELTGEENVYLNTSIHGLLRADSEAMYPAIVAYSGLEHFMDVPIKNYSSGMHMRLGFAIAANLDPDILLLDEVFAVGDADFQQQCIRTLTDFRARGKTIFFVSHSAESVRTICRRVLVLDHGRLLFDGGVDEGLDFYARLLAGEPTAMDEVAAEYERTRCG